MANSPITVRFTDELYATRMDVVRILGTNLIDGLWNEIIKYRNGKKHIINVLDISHMPYFITYTDKVNAKISAIPQYFARFAGEFAGILGGEVTQKAVEKDLYRASLRAVAKLNNIQNSDISLDKVIDHKAFEETHLILANYFEAISMLNPKAKIDENFLANKLAILRGEQELTSFYRENDIETESSRYIISREYEAAPARDIEFLMNGLLAYLNDATEPLINKIAATIYMFDYGKPFEKYNNEMCLVILKQLCCAKNPYIPIENALAYLNNFKVLSKETQKTRDLTYVFLPAADLIEKAVTSALDKVVQMNGHDVQQTYYAGDDKKEFEKEFGIKPEEGVVAPKVEIEPAKPVEQPKVEVKPEPVVEQPKVVVKPAPVVQKPIERTVQIKPVVVTEEKELKKRAKQLLESDPYLKKAQADFYVRHCEIGKFYTIQQFKKEERVVYETARTSMENLVKLGYYRKEQIKNKFVYTPIEK